MTLRSTLRSSSRSTAVRSLRRPARRATALLTGAGLALGLLVALVPTAAGASTSAGHNPIGMLHSDRGANATGVGLHGWALDLDSPATNVVVFALVDGVTRASVTTSLPEPGVVAKYHSGPTAGFRISVPVPAGKHVVCLGVRNLGGGTDTLFACLGTPLGRSASSGELAAHSPTGSLTGATATTSSVHVTGLVTDPDFPAGRLTVVLYVDGYSTVTTTTSATRAGAPVGTGSNATVDLSAGVSTGTHQLCVWAVNVGWGHNTFLGCRTVDTRAGQPLAAGAPSTAILAKIVAEAKSHIGQRYVWGATGPKTFDCSGLVVYSYKKFGFVTPRISEDQSRAARLIPASHAQPGDLVFYHDTEGDVYHVGIYLAPGKTVAAIDEQEGVNYQSIWDPSSTTYGSFTHL